MASSNFAVALADGCELVFDNRSAYHLYLFSSVLFSDGSKYILLHATNRVTSELVSPQEITQILNDNLMKTFQIYLAFTYSDILAEYIDQLAQK